MAVRVIKWSQHAQAKVIGPRQRGRSCIPDPPKHLAEGTSELSETCAQARSLLRSRPEPCLARRVPGVSLEFLKGMCPSATQRVRNRIRREIGRYLREQSEKMPAPAAGRGSFPLESPKAYRTSESADSDRLMQLAWRVSQSCAGAGVEGGSW